MYVGIDPGTSGAIAVLDKDGQLLRVCDMPSAKIDKSHYIKAEPFINAVKDCEHACIELVGSRGGNSANSMFSFGAGFGSALTLLYMCDLKPEMPLPQAWQKYFNLGSIKFPKVTKQSERDKAKKKQIAEKCLELYPEADLYGPRGGFKDGRSDAILIARYLFDLKTIADNKEAA